MSEVQIGAREHTNMSSVNFQRAATVSGRPVHCSLWHRSNSRQNPGLALESRPRIASYTCNEASKILITADIMNTFESPRSLYPRPAQCGGCIGYQIYNFAIALHQQYVACPCVFEFFSS